MKKLLPVFLILLLTFSLFAGGKEEEAKKSDPVEFVLYNGAEPESLDPAVISGVPEHRIYLSLFEGLVTYDPETANPVPGLAESWEISDDGLTYTFKLRKTTWSDGTPITAQNVVDSWMRILNPDTASQYAWMTAMIVKGGEEYNGGKAGPEAVKIKAVNDNTFQIGLVGPAPYALGMLAHYAFSVQPIHAIKEHGEKWTHVENIVSNGPFKLESWQPQEKVTVVPNEKYWDRENVKLDRVVYLPIEDDNTAYTMFKNNELDWCSRVPLEMLDEAKQSGAYQVGSVMISYYYVFNTRRKPFDDARVRKAFAISIDRKEIVEKITRAGELPAFGITPKMAGYPPIKGNAENVEEAKKLLAEAGYADGKGIDKITILYNTSEAHKKIAEYVQQKWSENLGVKVELENQEWKTYLKTRQEGQFDVSRAGWAGDYQDPNTFLELFVSTSAINGGKYNNPEFDELIKKAARMPGGKERMATLKKAEELLITQDQGIMPIYYYALPQMIDTDKWGGWYWNTLDIHPLKNIFMK